MDSTAVESRARVRVLGLWYPDGDTAPTSAWPQLCLRWGSGFLQTEMGDSNHLLTPEIHA